MARMVFDMIDVDNSGTLVKQEIIQAVSSDQKVIDFLVNCGNPNLQYLLVPARLELALNQLDTDSDGEIDACEWEQAPRPERKVSSRCRHARGSHRPWRRGRGDASRRRRGVHADIFRGDGDAGRPTVFDDGFRRRRGDDVAIPWYRGRRRQHANAAKISQNRPETRRRRSQAIEAALKAKLEQRRAQREKAAAADRKEIEEFTAEFLNARAGVVYCPRLAPAAGQSRIAAGFAPFSHSFVSRRRASASSSLTKTTRGP